MASAAVMHIAEQCVRTFFVTALTHQKMPIFQTDRMATGLKEAIAHYRKLGKFDAHALVIMPDHIHLLLTPASDISLEKAMQLIKGGFSFRAKKDLGFTREIWTRGFNEHRVKDWEDFERHRKYIALNPSRRGLRSDYQWVWPRIDACPQWLKPPS